MPYEITNLAGEILLRVALVVGVCAMMALVQPRIRYISQEELLRDLKRPRRNSCVPMWSLMCLIVLIPLVIFSLPWLLTNDVADTTQAILGWTLALAITAVVTESLKLAVGRPRPDFFYRCFPDGRMAYAENLQCTGYSRDVMEGRKSFPSGHCSFSFASLGFLSAWMLGRWRAAWGGRRARAAAAALPLLAAGAVGASRVRDHRHHLSDVLAGAALGVLAAYYCHARYYHPVSSNRAGLSYAATDDPDSTTSSRILRTGYLNTSDVELSDIPAVKK